MMKKVRHVLGISGGKDSAALAIYMRNRYPDLDIEYYTSDTGKELDETYQLIENLEVYLGKKIIRLAAADNSPEVPFDHFLKMYGGFLPSSQARWCTNKLKLEPFEKFVGTDPVISYVGIRGDENREGYISKKQNIQSIFPFRQNIWSEDVISKTLDNSNISNLQKLCNKLPANPKMSKMTEVLITQISPKYTQNNKLNKLLDISTSDFNRIVFEYLKDTEYPLSTEPNFPLLTNEDVLVKKDIFEILTDSGVGIPEYYKEIEFDIDGKKASYARSRSGCYFCFYQQKIEWVWLYEQHPNLFAKAMEYERDGYTWMQEESLEELISPTRIKAIKQEYIRRTERLSKKNSSSLLIDILNDSDTAGCASCFI